MRFPNETIPDATVWAPHHGIYGPLAALVVAALVVHHYRDHDPVAVIGGSLAGLFGFLFVWPWYPAIGAALALGGYAAALAAAVNPWGEWWPRYPAGHHAVVVGGLLVGLDDVVDHSFPVWTPLDEGWALLGPTVSSVLAVAAVLTAMYAISHRTEVTDT